MLTVCSLLDGAVIRIIEARAVILMLALLLISDKIVVMTNPELKHFKDLERPTPLEVCTVLELLTNGESKTVSLEGRSSSIINVEWEPDLRDDIRSARGTIAVNDLVCLIEVYEQPEIPGGPGISWLNMSALDEKRLPVFGRVVISEEIDDIHGHNDMNLFDQTLTHWLSVLDDGAAALK